MGKLIDEIHSNGRNISCELCKSYVAAVQENVNIKNYPLLIVICTPTQKILNIT